MEKWKCIVCGYIHEGPLPADFVCPVCGHPQSYFEVRAEDDRDHPRHKLNQSCIF